MTNLQARAEWTALKTVHARAGADVRLASPATDWSGIAASRFRLGQMDVSLPPLNVPAFGVNYGEPLRLERTLHGRRTSGHAIPGQLAILPPDADTRWIFDKTGDIVLVYISRKLLDQAVEEMVDRDTRLVEIIPRFLVRDLILERSAHQILREIAEPRPESRLAAEALAQGLIGHLISAHSNLAHLPTRRACTMAPARLKRTQEFVRANFGRTVRLREMAEVAGMSLFHFARAFREATGRTPHQYVLEQRLCVARTLLHDPGVSTGEIARTIGFTHSHLTAAFRRRMGMTPSEFRDVLRC